MSRSSLIILHCVALLLALNACNSTNAAYEEELRKDEYLKSNFPAKKKGENPKTPVETSFDR